jgi:hypothetical protein
MSKYKAILDVLLSTVYKIGGDHEIAEALNSDEENLDEKAISKMILDLDKSRVKDIRTKSHDDGHKKATAEALSKLEKDLKESFELGEDVEDLKGIDLVKHIIEKSGTKSEKELTLDQIKRSPEYIRLQDSLKKQIDDLNKSWEAKLNEKESSIKKEKVMEKVSGKAMEILDSLNPILSTDPAKAAKQKQILVNELKGLEFEDQDGTIVVLKDGKVLEDEHGHRVQFENLVKTTASQYFDFKAAKEERSSPNGDGATPPKTTFSGKLPATEADYLKAIADDNIPLAERVAIKEAWKASQQTT